MKVLSPKRFLLFCHSRVTFHLSFSTYITRQKRITHEDIIRLGGCTSITKPYHCATAEISYFYVLSPHVLDDGVYQKNALRDWPYSHVSPCRKSNRDLRFPQNPVRTRVSIQVVFKIAGSSHFVPYILHSPTPLWTLVDVPAVPCGCTGGTTKGRV